MVQDAGQRANLARNLAFGRLARQSSSCEWSVGATPEASARGDNRGGGFHSALEKDPGWQLDLGGEAAVERMVVCNRMEFRERCVRRKVVWRAGRACKVEGTQSN